MTFRAYVIHVGPRGEPRLTFGAMAESVSRAVEQYIDLAEVNEEVQAIPLRDEPMPLKLVRHELQTGQMREVMNHG